VNGGVTVGLAFDFVLSILVALIAAHHKSPNIVPGFLNKELEVGSAPRVSNPLGLSGALAINYGLGPILSVQEPSEYSATTSEVP